MDGSAAPMNEDTRLRRQAEEYILRESPSYKQYQQFLRTDIDPGTGGTGKHRRRGQRRAAAGQGLPWWASLRGGRQRRILRVRKEKWTKYVRSVRSKYRRTEVVVGDVGKRRVKHTYTPKPKNPALNGSGLMIDSLSGRARKGRSWTAPDGRRMSAQAHVQISVARSRQRTAAWVGGLTQATMPTGMLPETQAVADQAVWWDTGTVERVFFAARLTWRILRLLGGN